MARPSSRSAATGATGAASDNVTGDNYTYDGVFWQVMIHVVFIGSAIALAWIDRMSTGTHAGPASAPAVEAPIDPTIDECLVRAENELTAARYEEMARDLPAR